tara:strand:+ start:1992 stop:2228 length:237 start_codon:yes stop_codon:yes gene_type:complete
MAGTVKVTKDRISGGGRRKSSVLTRPDTSGGFEIFDEKKFQRTKNKKAKFKYFMKSVRPKKPSPRQKSKKEKQEAGEE